MSVWMLYYEDGLFLKVPENEIDSFLISSFYKISLKGYVGNVNENIIEFKT